MVIKDSSVSPNLDFSIIQTKEMLTSPPKSSLNQQFIDNFKIFSDPTVGINDICNYVDNQNVKQVWIWMYHGGSPLTVPIESNMSMGTDSRSYWNGGSYGDISNSAQSNDLPTCQKTYTVFDYNYERGEGEALESWGHQIEHVLNWVDGRESTPLYQWSNLLFWGKFAGSDGSQLIVTHRCGFVEQPPNATGGYDWRNETTVSSDCEDWKPDNSGIKKDTNCHTWTDYYYPGLDTCIDDGGRSYKVWWMQNIPGNTSLTYNGSNLRNWWDFIGNFDTATASGKSLLMDIQPPTIPTNLRSSNVYSTKATISWDSSQDASGVDSYQVKRDGSLITTTNQTTFTDYTLTASRSYQYTISAKDILGYVSSDSTPLTVLTNNSPPPAFSEPSLDSQAVSSGSANKIEWYQNVGNGPNRLLIVSVGMRKDGATNQVESVSYKDTTLTKIGAVDQGGVRTELWRLINPSTGYEKITVNTSIGVPNVVSSMTWYGVDQTNPTGQFASSMGGGSNPSVNVQSGTNEVVVDSLTMPNLAEDLFTEGSNQAKIWDKWIQGDTHNAGSQKEGASTVSMTWNTKWEAYALAAVSLKPAPDAQPPIVAITSPGNGITVSGSVSVTANASDNVGVSKVEFYIDNTPKSTITASPYTYSWDTTGYSSDSHTLSAIAYDAAGNTGTSTSVTVTVNNTQCTEVGDLNCDNYVNILDLSILITNWRASSGVADINKDGIVNI